MELPSPSRECLSFKVSVVAGEQGPGGLLDAVTIPVLRLLPVGTAGLAGSCPASHGTPVVVSDGMPMAWLFFFFFEAKIV